jgi:hypothetical protein
MKFWENKEISPRKMKNERKKKSPFFVRKKSLKWSQSLSPLSHLTTNINGSHGFVPLQ